MGRTVSCSPSRPPRRVSARVSGAGIRVSSRGPAVRAHSCARVRGTSRFAIVAAKTRLARTILAHADIRSALIRRDAVIQDSHVFNTELDFKTNPVTNQKSSGRCWLFATTNVLRYQVMQKFNLKDFQLSQVRARFLMGQIEGCL